MSATLEYLRYGGHSVVRSGWLLASDVTAGGWGTATRHYEVENAVGIISHYDVIITNKNELFVYTLNVDFAIKAKFCIEQW